MFRLLVALQRDEGARQGFTGDLGFVTMQIGLMSNASDSTIAYSNAMATFAVLRRAGVTLPA